ncbi:hypothetical protein [Alkaliphilus peptidifermentans]|uniref:Uncharacterized protein n=1 Tax=Alkaliphilus peptidifermentans DSM 18978 TaxID=1120976 RepID=A0A1G5JEZ2_9FIRM|nr:hypothetical protein [Alkaliphilus peptidifermentans]SCY86480.1 hypothetical protein SAMN03080606_02787 [Alkaliphilus peptidifermentans DSM 18978]
MITYDSFKQVVLEDISKTYQINFQLSHREWIDAVEQVQRDLLYNRLYFQKEVTYDDFVNRLYIFLSMKLRNHADM